MKVCPKVARKWFIVEDLSYLYRGMVNVSALGLLVTPRQYLKMVRCQYMNKLAVRDWRYSMRKADKRTHLIAGVVRAVSDDRHRLIRRRRVSAYDHVRHEIFRIKEIRGLKYEKNNDMSFRINGLESDRSFETLT